jgi:hypothetical protein
MLSSGLVSYRVAVVSAGNRGDAGESQLPGSCRRDEVQESIAELAGRIKTDDVQLWSKENQCLRARGFLLRVDAS